MRFRQLSVALLALALTPLLSAGEAHAGRQTIKIAVLAPEGTTWMKALRDADKELRKAKDKKVKLKIYGGGVMGDEADVLRKMQVGQVHAGGFTGVGLGKVCGEARVVEQPMLFRSYAEVDKVLAHLDTRLRKCFDDAGFVFLGWAEAGMVHLFTQKSVKSRDDLAGLKMWAWEGDPVAKAMYAAFNIVPVPLALTDVLTSLQTGMIEGVYAPPLGALALQWHTRSKFVTDKPIVYASGGVLITKKKWSKMEPDQQQLLKDVVGKHLRTLVEATRKENDAALKGMPGHGVKIVPMSEAQANELRAGAAKARKALAGKIFPEALGAEVDKVLSGLR